MFNADLNELSTKELALLFSVTDRAVRKWVEAGIPHGRDAKGTLRFKWKDAFEWNVAFRFKGSVAMPKSTGVPSKAKSEAAILATRARREELKLQREERNLIPVEEIEPAWLRLAETVKNRVLTLKAKAKEALPHLTNDDQKTLDRLCREALEELSQCPSQAPSKN